MFQFLFSGLSSRRVQPTNLLPTGVVITSNKHHRRLLPTEFTSVLQPEAYSATERSLRSYPINPLGFGFTKGAVFGYSPIFFQNPHFSRWCAFLPPPPPPYADRLLFALARTELFMACRSSMLVLVWYPRP